jgi:UDP-3-O-[3-hydroxymyristoyl] glucosamine N-acyltransferase
MATINYWGLSKKGSVTVALTVTIDQLIAAIATDEALATEYYTVSSLYDPSKSSLTYGDSSTTLTQLGLVDGGTVLCTTNQYGSKQERQEAKLAIAAKKRSLTDRYYALTIDNLPTKYTGNAVTDNANVGGLVAGRPWSAALG